jgi:ADP-ribose pyrophosphatase YjhB (NUDIX family)
VYVFPGGGVHDGESLRDAMSQEVFEETGLQVDNWKLESLCWESVYPTVAAPGVPIKAHHMVCYFSGQLCKASEHQQCLDLCKEEVDGAAWLSIDNAETIVAFDRNSTNCGEEQLGGNGKVFSKTLSMFTNNKNETMIIPLNNLMGIYPQFDSTKWRHCGFAQGSSLFALQQ